MQAASFLAAALLGAILATPASADGLDRLQTAIANTNKEARIGALITIQRPSRTIVIRTGLTSTDRARGIATSICDGAREAADPEWHGVTIKVLLGNGTDGSSCTVG